MRRTPPEQAAIARAVRSALDPTRDPCDDFYQYACGGWLARVPPPGDRPQWMRSFSTVDARNRALLLRLLERPGADRGHRQAAAYFDACMDVAAIEAARLRPLEPWLRAIEAAQDLPALFAVAARLHEVPGASPLLGIALERDPDAPARRVLALHPGGLGLPDPRLYEDEAAQDLRADYRRHVAAMLELAGERTARARAQARAVLALERALARAAADAQPRPVVGRAALVALAPELPWDAWFAALGAPGLEAVRVERPDFVRALGATLRATDPETVRVYLRWQLLHAAAERLGRRFDEEDFRFRAKLTGQTVMPPRPDRCVDATVAALPELVSRIWVEAAFPGESRAIARAMLASIAERFVAGLPEIAWMDEATRAHAAAKARRIELHAGHPDAMPADAGFEVDAEAYLANAIAAQRRLLARRLAAAGARVDPDEWPVAAVALRAFLDPRANALYVPAGLLQPPFFDRSFPPALRWGAIGPLMGHEWIHGFDAQGAWFGADGRLEHWWSEATARGFADASACLVEQYDAYEVAPGVHQDGRRTLVENAADLAGIALAHRAWRAEAGGEAEAPSFVEGLTREQLFFVAHAQTWCASAQPGYDLAMARRDARARPRFRTNGPLANLPAFRRAFACAPGTPMAPPRTCSLWPTH